LDLPSVHRWVVESAQLTAFLKEHRSEKLVQEWDFEIAQVCRLGKETVLQLDTYLQQENL